MFPSLSIISVKWWPKPGLNRRHKDFQSSALPTELPGLLKKMAIQKGLEPSISSVTGRHVNHYTTGPFINLVAGGRFELPTSGLWARRATTALPRDIDEQVYNGGGRGIRTPAPVSRSTGFQDRTLQPLGYSSNNYGGPCRTWTHTRPVMSREL